MSCLKVRKIVKTIFCQKKTHIGENLPKELLDKIRTKNVEKNVRIPMTEKTVARYIIKCKPDGKRSERRKKSNWYAVLTINLDTNKHKIFS